MSTIGPDGGIRQSALLARPGDYAHERLYYPVVGVVLNIHASDEPYNVLTVSTSAQRGSGHTCDVYVVGHGNDQPWIIPNVIVLPRGPSGVDDYCEDLPRPCSFMVDGSQFGDQPGAVDLTKADGDWCVVMFIGGSIMSPVMVNWFPHPGNTTDPATFGFPLQPAVNGQTDAKTLKQGRRSFRRVAGLKATVTARGSLFLDTNESNAEVSGSSQKKTLQRKKRELGGDIQIDVKKERRLQVNFNPPVALPDDEPSLPQPNPPDGPQQDRETTATAATFDQKTIEMIAGEVMKLITLDKNIEIKAKKKVTVVGEDGNDSVVLGDTDTANCDHAVSGETFLQNRFDLLVNLFKAHTHNTSVGPTDVPTNAGSAQTSQPADLSGAVMVKKK